MKLQLTGTFHVLPIDWVQLSNSRLLLFSVKMRPLRFTHVADT